jgi:D-alanyl-D-alanine carboxypeptidase/D-alanyl-D-alanine-endopeptidase (penicillin-binding protein 4)
MTDAPQARLTRRGLLGGGLALLAGGAAAQELRPLARPAPPAPPTGALAAPPATRLRARQSLPDVIREAGLEGRVSVALVDVGDGTVLAAHEAARPMPPASVAKALTALWALDAFPLDHSFSTRLLAAGAVEGGVVKGDLILAGGGDPGLDTDRLAGLAARLAGAGITGADGFRVWPGPLPEVREIDPGQLPHLAYNPAVSGLNLNFNRVFFEWAAQGGGRYRTVLDARGEEFRPRVAVARMTVEPRNLPVYTYAQDGPVDVWTVARGQLGEAGSRWLPVRAPALYAGQAFRALAEGQGVRLPPPVLAAALPEGAAEVATLPSEPVEALLKEMLLYSTNLTAEVLGREASLARGLGAATPAESARHMSDWLARETGARVRLVDHSGLGPASRVAPAEMALALASRGTMERLRPLLRSLALTDAAGEALARPPALVRAKTGTLNFVSTLAGYARTLEGEDLAFAIFAADLDARARAAGSDDEIPEGSRDFLARARRLQQVLLQRWGAGVA